MESRLSRSLLGSSSGLLFGGLTLVIGLVVPLLLAVPPILHDNNTISQQQSSDEKQNGTINRFVRNVQAFIGGKMISWANDKTLKDSQLVQKSVVLPKMGITMHYLERSGAEEEEEDSTNNTTTTTSPAKKKTLLLCHGFTQEAKFFARFVISLNLPPDVRILIPEMIGHGQDLARAVREKDSFRQPTPLEWLQSTIEFLDVLSVPKNNNCHAIGYSMGAVMVYFLRQQRPDLVEKTVLIAPGLESCLDEKFVSDFVNGRKLHLAWETRDQVMQFFSDLSVPHRIQKNPVPLFFLEAIVRERQRRVPKGHFKAMMEQLLQMRLADPSLLGCQQDIDPDSSRLVIWAEYDYICNHEKGKQFFQESSNNKRTDFETIQDCGHMFHSDGKPIFQHARPLISNYLCW